MAYVYHARPGAGHSLHRRGGHRLRAAQPGRHRHAAAAAGEPGGGRRPLDELEIGAPPLRGTGRWRRDRLHGAAGGTEARRAEFHYRLGDWDEALSAVARACGLPVSDGWLPVVVHGLRALVLGHRGEREAAQAELAGLPDDAFATPGARRYASHVQLARALLAERDGRPADALRALRPGQADGAEAAEDLVSYERPWVLSEIVRLALESGESGTAREAVAACGRIAAALPDHPGPALALLRCRGLFAQDPELLAEAVLLRERGGWPLMLGRRWRIWRWRRPGTATWRGRASVLTGQSMRMTVSAPGGTSPGPGPGCARWGSAGAAAPHAAGQPAAGSRSPPPS